MAVAHPQYDQEPTTGSQDCRDGGEQGQRLLTAQSGIPDKRAQVLLMPTTDLPQQWWRLKKTRGNRGVPQRCGRVLPGVWEVDAGG